MNKQEAIQQDPEADSFDVRSSLERIKQTCLVHKLLIAFTCLLTISIVVAYIVIWPPIYKSEVVLIADHNEDSQRESFYQYWNVFRSDHLPDEVQLMIAGPLLRKTIHRLNLTYDEVYHPFLSYAAYLWSESWIGKKYRKLKKWIFPPQKSPYLPTPDEIEHARTFNDFKKGVKFEPIPETNVGRLIVSGSTPRVAQIANVLVEIYLNERLLRHVREAGKAYESLRVETKGAYTELLEHEARIKKYYDENALLLHLEKDKVELGRWLDLEGSIVDTNSVIATVESTLAEVDRQLSSENKEIINARVHQKNTLRESLKNRLYELKIVLKQIMQRYLPNSSEVLEIKEQIAAVEALIASEDEITEYQTTIVLSEVYESLRGYRNTLESELAGAKAGRKVMIKAAQDMKELVIKIPEKMRVLNGLNREHKILEKKYTILQERLMMAEVSKATAQSAPPSIRIIEPAFAPNKPSWPNKKLLIGITTILGLCSGICLALLIDVIHGRINLYQLLQARGDFPVYAIVSRDKKFVTKLFRMSVVSG